MLKLETVAEMAYECNRIYRRSLGEPETPSWNELDENVQIGLCRAVMDVCCDPKVTPRKQHKKWIANKHRQGWSYYTREDLDMKVSPNMVKYSKLPDEQKIKDMIFIYLSKLVVVEDLFMEKKAEAKKPSIRYEKVGVMRAGASEYDLVVEVNTIGGKTYYNLIRAENYSPDGAWIPHHIGDNTDRVYTPCTCLSHIVSVIENDVEHFEGKREFTFDPVFYEANRDIIKNVLVQATH